MANPKDLRPDNTGQHRVFDTVNPEAASLGMPRFNGASDDPCVEARLDALLQHLYTFYHTEIDLTLNRSYRFLEKLGNPHLKLPRVVHIAGTNGKGSTAATLRALLEASGQMVHMYTSPHLVHVTERIRLAGMPITSEALIEVVNECIEINQNQPITFFEMFTCAAFLAFSRTPADWLILETGMGGRLDTTNVVHDPALTIITSISWDHMRFLGDSLPKIASEKAGIMKPGVPCVIGHQFEEAVEAGVMDVFQKHSTDLSPAAPLVREGAEWCAAPEEGRMRFRYGNDSILTPPPSLSGNHQYWNTGAALAAFRLIAPEHFKANILSTGLTTIQWPGRLQTLENHPYNDLLPEGWDIVIDGGHNDSAGLVLAHKLNEWRKSAPGRPIHLVLAMVNRKDPRAFLAPMLPFVDSVTVTEIENEPTSFSVHELDQTVRSFGFPSVFRSLNSKQSVLDIVSRNVTSPGSRILMTGSLFLMGNILEKA